MSLEVKGTNRGFKCCEKSTRIAVLKEKDRVKVDRQNRDSLCTDKDKKIDMVSDLSIERESPL